jgi:hypothetical protein
VYHGARLRRLGSGSCGRRVGDLVCEQASVDDLVQSVCREALADLSQIAALLGVYESVVTPSRIAIASEELARPRREGPGRALGESARATLNRSWSDAIFFRRRS